MPELTTEQWQEIYAAQLKVDKELVALLREVLEIASEPINSDKMDVETMTTALVNIVVKIQDYRIEPIKHMTGKYERRKD